MEQLLVVAGDGQRFKCALLKSNLNLDLGVLTDERIVLPSKLTGSSKVEFCEKKGQ